MDTDVIKLYPWRAALTKISSHLSHLPDKYLMRISRFIRRCDTRVRAWGRPCLPLSIAMRAILIARECVYVYMRVRLSRACQGTSAV